MSKESFIYLRSLQIFKFIFLGQFSEHERSACHECKALCAQRVVVVPLLSEQVASRGKHTEPLCDLIACTEREVAHSADVVEIDCGDLIRCIGRVVDVCAFCRASLSAELVAEVHLQLLDGSNGDIKIGNALCAVEAEEVALAEFLRRIGETQTCIYERIVAVAQLKSGFPALNL